MIDTLFILIKLENLGSITVFPFKGAGPQISAILYKRLPSRQLFTRYLLETFSSDIKIFFLFIFVLDGVFFIL